MNKYRLKQVLMLALEELDKGSERQRKQKNPKPCKIKPSDLAVLVHYAEIGGVHEHGTLHD